MIVIKCRFNVNSSESGKCMHPLHGETLKMKENPSKIAINIFID